MHWNICFVPQVLKRLEYFGKFGKIHKVVINNSTSYAGSQVKLTQISAGCTSTWMKPVSHVSCCCVFSQGPSASAYVTYVRSEDALKAIQCVNNVMVDGRTLKVKC